LNTYLSGRKKMDRSDVIAAVAQGWCTPENAHKVVDPDLAMAIIEKVMELDSEPMLGLATTRQLLRELEARIEVDYYSGGGGLDYTSVKGRPESVDLSERGKNGA
jgi:hypothetical protein